MIFYLIFNNQYFYCEFNNDNHNYCLIVLIQENNFFYNIIDFFEIMHITEFFENFPLRAQNGIRALTDNFNGHNNILPFINTDNLEYLECHEIFLEEDIINLLNEETIEDYLIDDEDWHYNSD